jgi:hypothetical protein
MQQREFIILLGSYGRLLGRAPRAQQGERMRRIGALMGMAERDPQRLI